MTPPAPPGAAGLRQDAVSLRQSSSDSLFAMWILRSPVDAQPALTFRVLPGAAKTVGRAVRSDFILDAAMVSRVHCRLVVSQAGELEVEDLDSTNGTFVNDQRVRRAALNAGDRLRIGRVELAVMRDS
jgi:pSer/pThr/pTyr-binding forkhead associated (FHA) protein